jgi:hypothetical protein
VKDDKWAISAVPAQFSTLIANGFAITPETPRRMSGLQSPREQDRRKLDIVTQPRH